MYFKSALFIAVINCFLVSGCPKSEMKIEEKKAQNLLASSNLDDRYEGVLLLLQLQQKGSQLNRKTIDTIINTFENDVQTKKSFEEKGRGEGKNINEIMKEFDKQYPLQDYTNYLENIVAFIVSARAERGISVIFQFVLQGGYVFNDTILANFGTPAFDFLVDQATYGSDDEQALAFSMLSLWVNPPRNSDHVDPDNVRPLTEKQREQLRLLLLKSFQDTNPEIKYFTIRGLGAFQDDVAIKRKLLELSLQGETEEMRSQAKRILKEAPN